MNALPKEAASEITKYLDLLFGSRMGYIYIPTLDRNTEAWTQNFFLWPNNRSSAVEFITRKSPDLDVFVGVCMYKTDANAQKDNVLGTHVSYVDIDGTYDPSGAPIKPSFVVQSSDKDHMHCYWIMDSFNTSVESIEDANFRLAYRMETDNSGWDATQVLRPPLTWNHKRNKLTSDVIMNPKPVKGNWATFSSLDLPENARAQPLRPVEIQEIPSVTEVLARTNFPSEFFDLFRKNEIEQGKRSGAIMALAYYGAEMQLQNEEILAILLNADERWGKFKGRKDRIQRLLDSITRARAKYPFSGMPDLAIISRDFYTLVDTDYDVDWAIKEFLDRQGIAIWSGQAGAGKTQISLQVGLHLAMGKPFCGLEPPENLKQKISFMSQEMSDRQLGYIAKKIINGMSLEPGEVEDVRSNFDIPMLKERLLLDTPKGLDLVVEYIRRVRPVGIMFDSLGMMLKGDLNDDNSIRSALGALSDVAHTENVFFWFIHHNRKPQVNNKRPNALGDIYGSQYITSIASTVASMWPRADRVKDVAILKNRLGYLGDEFQVEHGMDLLFKLIGEVKVTMPGEVTSDTTTPKTSEEEEWTRSFE